jgi:DNA helicase-2/ATP-dependent DNA helicase PcrA
MILNDEQQAVVKAIDGTWVTVAGPGSGKTTVLIQRYLNMLMGGIKSKDILNLTFTAAAAEEMVNRVGLLNANKVFRTFHSFALELIKNERQHLPFKLSDTVIPVALEDYKLIFKLVESYKAINNYQLLKEMISGWKRSNMEPEQVIAESNNEREYFYGLAYRDYERRCREEGWLDFDSLMRETVKLLEADGTVRSRYQRSYISVDEAQDTDIVQFRLLQLIFAGNIFVVGDENQLIYEWRSAQPGSLSNFERLFPGARKLYLGENFRSTGELVSFFKTILPVDNGIASHMVTRNPLGEKPSFTKFFDDFSEASWIIDHLLDPPRTAILARTNRQLFIYQRLMSSRGIKYVFLGKKDFFDQKEIKHMLSLAKGYLEDTRPAHQILSAIIREHNLPALFRNFNPDEADPINNMNGLVKIAVEKGGNIKEFLDFMRKLMYGRKSTKKVKTVTLSTVHMAKGREWDHVYVIGVNEGRMPHRDGELNEERRIFFVACSRAAKTLSISYNGDRSMFLNSFGDQIKVHTSGLQN